MSLIEVGGLSKPYGPTLAVSKISFGVEAGRVLAVRGETGALKSTLMNMLSGACAPSGGEIRIDDKPVQLAGRVLADLGGENAVKYDDENSVF